MGTKLKAGALGGAPFYQPVSSKAHNIGEPKYASNKRWKASGKRAMATPH